MAPIAAEQALSECPNCAKSNAGDTAGKSAQGSPFGLEDIASHKAWRNILMMLSTAGGQGSQGHPVGAGGSSERQRQSGNENAADHETGSEDLPGDIQIKEEQGAPSNSFSRGGREVKKEPESPDIKPKVETAEGGTNLSQIAASEEGEGIASSTQIGDRNRNSGRQQMAPATLSSLRTSNIDLYAIPSAVPTPEPAAASPIPIVPEPSPEPQPQRQLRSTRRRRQQQSQRNLVPNPPRRRAQPSSSATSLRRSKRLRGEDAEMPEGLPAPLPRPKRRRVAR
ncbi:hypothetical protein AJ79_10096 [Helicocarpus griseus UAMH5409]|uniref:Uncharacterized protein n=1 Tax=Helicocarpus griseus UAMH5409 TaxID=1447875 RepID=A0A2B7WFK7_9EURO|nr:hypothetical protein AJ79_10096 [Helicocarpus griseus UAMH5409]